MTSILTSLMQELIEAFETADARHRRKLEEQEEERNSRPVKVSTVEWGQVRPRGLQIARALPSKVKRFYDSRIDWLAPSPLVERTTRGDVRGFHLTWSPQKRLGHPTFRGEPLYGFTATGPGHAGEHASYINRAEARDTFLGYEPGSASDYVGREGTAVSRYTNIKGGEEEARDYWNKVFEVESKPRQHLLWADVSKPQIHDLTRLLPAADAIGVAFHAHVAAELRRYEQAEDKDTWRPHPFKGTAEECGYVLHTIAHGRGCEPNALPIAFESGRGGHFQYRLVFSLPHEFSSEAAYDTLKIVCDTLGSLRDADHAEGPAGMMFEGVVHAPTGRNHEKNLHVHILAHDRPATWLEEEQEWDFYAIDKSSRRDRPRRLGANKLRMVNGYVRGDPRSGKNFPGFLRTTVAAAVNQVAMANQLDVRYHAGKSSERFAIETPTERLGPAAHQLERRGIQTAAGDRNADKKWGDEQRAASERRDMRLADLDRQLGNVEIARGWHGGDAYTTPAAKLHELGRAAIDDGHAAEEQFLRHAASRSRAEVVLQTCERELGLLERRKRRRREAAAQVTDLQEQATEFLRGLDLDVGAQVAALKRAQDEAEAAATKVRDLLEQLGDELLIAREADTPMLAAPSDAVVSSAEALRYPPLAASLADSTMEPAHSEAVAGVDADDQIGRPGTGIRVAAEGAGWYPFDLYGADGPGVQSGTSPRPSVDAIPPGVPAASFASDERATTPMRKADDGGLNAPRQVSARPTESNTNSAQSVYEITPPASSMSGASEPSGPDETAPAGGASEAREVADPALVADRRRQAPDAGSQGDEAGVAQTSARADGDVRADDQEARSDAGAMARGQDQPKRLPRPKLDRMQAKLEAAARSKAEGKNLSSSSLANRLERLIESRRQTAGPSRKVSAQPSSADAKKAIAGGHVIAPTGALEKPLSGGDQSPPTPALLEQAAAEESSVERLAPGHNRLGAEPAEPGTELPQPKGNAEPDGSEDDALDQALFEAHRAGGKGWVR